MLVASGRGLIPTHRKFPVGPPAVATNGSFDTVALTWDTGFDTFDKTPASSAVT